MEYQRRGKGRVQVGLQLLNLFILSVYKDVGHEVQEAFAVVFGRYGRDLLAVLTDDSLKDVFCGLPGVPQGQNINNTTEQQIATLLQLQHRQRLGRKALGCPDSREDRHRKRKVIVVAVG